MSTSLLHSGVRASRLEKLLLAGSWRRFAWLPLGWFGTSHDDVLPLAVTLAQFCNLLGRACSVGHGGHGGDSRLRIPTLCSHLQMHLYPFQTQESLMLLQRVGRRRRCTHASSRWSRAPLIWVCVLWHAVLQRRLVRSWYEPLCTTQEVSKKYRTVWKMHSKILSRNWSHDPTREEVRRRNCDDWSLHSCYCPVVVSISEISPLGSLARFQKHGMSPQWSWDDYGFGRTTLRRLGGSAEFQNAGDSSLKPECACIPTWTGAAQSRGHWCLCELSPQACLYPAHGFFWNALPASLLTRLQQCIKRFVAVILSASPMEVRTTGFDELILNRWFSGAVPMPISPGFVVLLVLQTVTENGQELQMIRPTDQGRQSWGLISVERPKKVEGGDKKQNVSRRCCRGSPIIRPLLLNHTFSNRSWPCATPPTFTPDLPRPRWTSSRVCKTSGCAAHVDMHTFPFDSRCIQYTTMCFDVRWVVVICLHEFPLPTSDEWTRCSLAFPLDHPPGHERSPRTAQSKTFPRTQIQLHRMKGEGTEFWFGEELKQRVQGNAAYCVGQTTFWIMIVSETALDKFWKHMIEKMMEWDGAEVGITVVGPELAQERRTYRWWSKKQGHIGSCLLFRIFDFLLYDFQRNGTCETGYRVKEAHFYDKKGVLEAEVAWDSVSHQWLQW